MYLRNSFLIMYYQKPLFNNILPKNLFFLIYKAGIDIIISIIIFNVVFKHT